MRHRDLPDAGRKTHREIDRDLPDAQEKATLRNLLQHAELELITDGNNGFDQDGNWRLRIDANGDLVLEARDSGSWIQQAKWTSQA